MDTRDEPINGSSRRFEVLGWPLERAVWEVQRRLIWPLQDRLSELDGPTRALAGAASAAIAICALAVGIGVAAGGSEQTAPVAAVAAAPSAEPAPAKPAPDPEPTLEGPAPNFKQTKPEEDGEKGGDSEAPAGGAPSETAPGTGSSAATDTISSSPSASPSGGIADVAGRPAGKQALGVARDFATAFVVYETGGESAKVRKAFAGSATKELATSLLRRPPRLPANVDVPKAKVINVVAAPSHDGIYPISVSLLRVGVTSELRLEMELLKGKRWRVTNVLG